MEENSAENNEIPKSKSFLGRLKRSWKKVRAFRSKTSSVEEPQDTPPLSEEPISVQFPFSDYRYWRDGLQQLQTGSHYDYHTDRLAALVLPGANKHSSYNMAWDANNIDRATMQGLREGRIDQKGQPFILCIDEVSDTQVLQGATPTEREEFVVKAISNLVDRFHHFPNESMSAAVVITSILTGNEPAQATSLVERAIAVSSLDPAKKNILTHHLQNLAQTRTRSLLTFIKGSKTRLIEEETQYTFKHGPRKYGSFREAYEASIETGEPLFNIEGRKFTAPGDKTSRELYTLSSQEVEMIQPLRQAIHHSRQEMTRQARLLAVRYLGIHPDPAQVPNPPAWWIKGEGDGLRSDEVLVFVPYRKPDEARAIDPPLLRNFSRGWYLLKISYDSDSDLRLKYVSQLQS